MTSREILLDHPIRLGDMKPGQSGVISRLQGPEALLRRLLEMGLVEEASVEVVRQAPFGGDPILIRVRGALLGIRRQEAGCVLVRKAAR